MSWRRLLPAGLTLAAVLLVSAGCETGSLIDGEMWRINLILEEAEIENQRTLAPFDRLLAVGFEGGSTNGVETPRHTNNQGCAVPLILDFHGENLPVGFGMGGVIHIEKYSNCPARTYTTPDQ